MNYFKKGLAVALAAACAFTFAPVAATTLAANAETTDKTEVSYSVKGEKKTAQTDAALSASKKTNAAIELDTVVNKTTTIAVANTSAAVYYMPEDATVVSAKPAGSDDKTATVAALKAGNTKINITVGSAKYSIPVNVSSTGSDVVKTQVNGKDASELDLDSYASTAPNAVKSVKITGSSLCGLPVVYDLYTDKDGKAIAGNSNAIASVAQDGTVTAGKTAGTVYVKVYTADSNARQIKGDAKWVKVTVNTDAQAIITAPSEIKLDFKNHSKVDLAKEITSNAKNATVSYTKKAYDKQNVNAADITGTVLSAKQIGEMTLVVNVGKGTDTRATSKEIKVSVVDEIKKSAAKITVAPNVRLLVGGTQALDAKTTATGAAISYSSDNTSVADVDSATGIVTAKAAGIATITVKSAATDDFDQATATVTVIVDKQEIVVKPQTVKGVKVANVKGAKVKVSWKSQGGNVLYRVYKKVGSSKKWSGKNVTGSSTTLAVKSGAKVTVKVKAYTVDATGKKTWGPKATVAKAFKTDRK